jgi:RNA polymerase sigma-70 factor (ECF subfamily)
MPSNDRPPQSQLSSRERLRRIIRGLAAPDQRPEEEAADASLRKLVERCAGRRRQTESWPISTPSGENPFSAASISGKTPVVLYAPDESFIASGRLTCLDWVEPLKELYWGSQDDEISEMLCASSGYEAEDDETTGELDNSAHAIDPSTDATDGKKYELDVEVVRFQLDIELPTGRSLGDVFVNPGQVDEQVFVSQPISGGYRLESALPVGNSVGEQGAKCFAKVSSDSGPYADRGCDVDLVHRFCEGDELAFETLAERYHGLIRSAIWKRGVRNDHDIDDLTQDVLLIMARRIGELKIVDSIAAWLYRVAWNEAGHFLDRRRETSWDSENWGRLSEIGEDGTTPSAEIHVEKTLQELKSRLDKSNEFYWVAINLRCVEDLSRGAVADIIGMSTTATSQLLDRAKKRAREILETISVPHERDFVDWIKRTNTSSTQRSSVR